MNRRQRKLVHKWIALTCAAIGVLVLEWLLEANSALFRGILLLGMIAALTYEGQSSAASESSSDRIGRIVAAHPWIKWWLGLCALSAAALAVAAIRYDIDLQARLGFGGLLTAILLIGAPILIMGERERFLEYGAPRDAA